MKINKDTLGSEERGAAIFFSSTWRVDQKIRAPDETRKRKVLINGEDDDENAISWLPVVGGCQGGGGGRRQFVIQTWSSPLSNKYCNTILLHRL